MNIHQYGLYALIGLSLLIAACGGGDGGSGGGTGQTGEARVIDETRVGTDANNPTNPAVQPQDDVLAGGGRDQTLQSGDNLRSAGGNDLLVGRLGSDVLLGEAGDDVLIGGPEGGNAPNRDRGLGGRGADTFIWAGGDGSDFFDGGPGAGDTVIFGLIGRDSDTGAPVFLNVDAGAPVFTHPETGLPAVDVTLGPGFCRVIDDATSPDSAGHLDALNLDHLVRFFARNAADSFAAGSQDDDNGLRVTLHLRDVEFLVCTGRAGGTIEVLDLTTAPPSPAALTDLPKQVQAMVR